MLCARIAPITWPVLSVISTLQASIGSLCLGAADAQVSEFAGVAGVCRRPFFLSQGRRPLLPVLL